MAVFQIEPATLPPAAEALRAEVRAFLAETLAMRRPAMRARSWMGFDADFSRAVGARGWIGMTWPRRHGGHERTAFERYVVLEELLAAGAPVAAHWIADRQSGPLLLRYGTEAQRARILPRIARGECFFCIGMSEPDAGSDLAAIRTRAVRTPDGWRVNGTKLWTSAAERSHYMIALFRTGEGERQRGLSQFLVDLAAPGIAIRPIRNLAGEEHFNEVVFTDALLPAAALVGEEGNGWAQATAELAYERSGPERYLSSIQALLQLVDAVGPAPSEATLAAIGRLVARLATLRETTIALAAMLDAGREPALEAALLKDLGNAFEQELPVVVQALVDVEPVGRGGPDLPEVLGYLTQLAPSFSLRGGTREVLRGIIARGLGLR